MDGLYERTKELLETDKFLCMLGGEHSVSAPIIKAHAEKFTNLSVLQIDAHADLRDTYDGTPHSHASIMARVVKDLHIPAVQVGIRSISGDEARAVKDGLPTKIFWARDIVGRTDWIDDAVDSLPIRSISPSTSTAWTRASSLLRGHPSPAAWAGTKHWRLFDELPRKRRLSVWTLLNTRMQKTTIRRHFSARNWCINRLHISFKMKCPT